LAIKAPSRGKGRIRTDSIATARKPQGIRYKARKLPSMAALYQAADSGELDGETAMQALYAKIANGGPGGTAALVAFLDALE